MLICLVANVIKKLVEFVFITHLILVNKNFMINGIMTMIFKLIIELLIVQNYNN